MGSRDFHKKETKKPKKGNVKAIEDVQVQSPEVEVIRKPRKIREEEEE